MRLDYTKIFLIIALFAFGARLFLAQYLTYQLDLDTFKYWSYYLADYGFKSFYANVWSDYLPGYHYVLWLLGIMRLWLINNSILFNENIFYKIPSIIADIGNALFIFLIAKKFTTSLKSLIVATSFLINPAILANSTFWGQADSFTTFFLLSSFYFLIENNFWLTAILIGFGIVIKPIAVLSIPIYLIYIFLISKKNGVIKSAIFIAMAISTAVLAFIPFNYKSNLIQFIIERYQQTFHQYTYTSLNAFNFWAIPYNFWTSDKLIFSGITLQNWGQILFGIIYALLLLFLLLKLKSTFNKTFFLSLVLSICYLAMFVLLTRMHERHMFYALGFMALLLPKVPFFGIFMIMSANIIYILNLLFAYLQLIQKPSMWDHNIITLFSLINMAVLFYLFKIFIFKYVKSN